MQHEDFGRYDGVCFHLIALRSMSIWMLEHMTTLFAMWWRRTKNQKYIICNEEIVNSCGNTKSCRTTQREISTVWIKWKRIELNDFCYVNSRKSSSHIWNLLRCSFCFINENEVIKKGKWICWEREREKERPRMR